MIYEAEYTTSSSSSPQLVRSVVFFHSSGLFIIVVNCQMCENIIIDDLLHVFMVYGSANSWCNKLSIIYSVRTMFWERDLWTSWGFGFFFMDFFFSNFYYFLVPLCKTTYSRLFNFRALLEFRGFIVPYFPIPTDSCKFRLRLGHIFLPFLLWLQINFFFCFRQQIKCLVCSKGCAIFKMLLLACYLIGD